MVVYLNKVIDERYSFICGFFYTTVKLHYCVSNPWRRIVLFMISHPVAIWVFIREKGFKPAQFSIFLSPVFCYYKKEKQMKNLVLFNLFKRLFRVALKITAGSISTQSSDDGIPRLQDVELEKPAFIYSC